MAEPIKPEQWKTIKEFPNYAVSSYGRVKRIAPGKSTRIGKIIKATKTKKGYYTVHFSCAPQKRQPYKFVHRLVLEAFVSSCPEGKECNHKDGNKTNNRPENLEWVTSSQNQRHSYKKGLSNPCTKLTKSEVIQIRQLYKSCLYSQKNLAKLFRVGRTTIYNIIHFRKWKNI